MDIPIIHTEVHQGGFPGDCPEGGRPVVAPAPDHPDRGHWEEGLARCTGCRRLVARDYRGLIFPHQYKPDGPPYIPR